MASIYIKEGTELPERRPHDFYETAQDDVLKGLDVVEEARRRFTSLHWCPQRVLDPGSGDGAWGYGVLDRWRPQSVVGVELRDIGWPRIYDRWHVGDYLALSDTLLMKEDGYDLIVGNPPYSDAEAFVRRSLDLLKPPDMYKPGGFLVFLLRLTFLESQRRGNGLFKEYPPVQVAVCKKRPSFSKNGKTSPDAYCFCVWSKGYAGGTWLSWI